MSEQISEKMARKLAWVVAKYMYHNPDAQPDDVERQINDWRSAGLIKPSKLDEVREWCKNICDAGLRDGDTATEYDEAYRQGVMATEAKYEAAITEILGNLSGEVL